MGPPSAKISEFPLGERIRYFRKSRGLTQKSLGFSVGLTQGSIAQIEKSQTSPTLVSLNRIAKALDVHIAIFFADESVFVFDLKAIKRKYRQREQAPSSLRSAFEVIQDFLDHYR